MTLPTGSQRCWDLTPMSTRYIGLTPLMMAVIHHRPKSMRVRHQPWQTRALASPEERSAERPALARTLHAPCMHLACTLPPILFSPRTASTTVRLGVTATAERWPDCAATGLPQVLLEHGADRTLTSTAKEHDGQTAAEMADEGTRCGWVRVWMWVRVRVRVRGCGRGRG